MMFSKRWIAVCAVMTTFGQMSMASAGSISGQIGVQMVIEPSCMVSSGSASSEGVEQWGTLDFGTHSELSTTKTAQTVGVSSSDVEIQCSEGLTTATLKFDGGLREGASGYQYMQNTESAASSITYSVYSDAGYTNRLVAGATMPNAGLGAENTTRYAFYGRVTPGEQSTVMPAAGTYTDTLQFTLAW